MYEKDARTRNKECCHSVTRFKRVFFQTKLALSEFPPVLRFLHHFSPKNPNFDSPTPKFIPKVCLYVYVLKKAIKTISNLKSNTIPHNSSIQSIFHKNSQQQLSSHHNFTIMNTHGINQQQQHLTTTETSLNHEFINNYNHKIILHQFE